ncbi:efflux RND transporter periplasmic adaptor subunit [Salinisphaera sp. USBA-960]|uniref:efflux RND transporter periplasmic adaptor subunit n=1 Tax=Salinisphaera orenii TaxID=856731 RepID=UPI000DBE2866|nr:efflux RND transporter periplasmic adaptor subunit [Salifodinibacter halophilus]NNC25957.1 efflux RND transporter periplasmic adaptor subunit [Salifodinibacter halophilus]
MSEDGPEDKRARLGPWVSAIVAVLVILIGGVVAYWLLTHPPSAPQGEQTTKHRGALVSVERAQSTPQHFMIKAHGQVEAADSTQLQARVNGRIVKLDDSLAPGTRFQKNDALAQIERSDYKLALERAKTDLATAKAKLATEKGQQAVAKRELQRIGADNVTAQEKRLALRGPQRRQAKARVRSARSSVKQARLDLKRTTVRAPFNGIVTSRSASIGDVVATSTPIATLAATDRYWVNISLPVKQIRWLHAATPHQTGSAARVYYPEAWHPDDYLNASILRIQGMLEKKGRMAQVLLQIPNPLGDASNKDKRLLLGAYVPVRIQAQPPNDAVTIRASNLRENDHVWIKTADDKLAIRKVTVAYQDDQRAIVTSGLKPGDAVVTTDLAAPIAGEPLRARHNKPASAGSNEATSGQNRDAQTNEPPSPTTNKASGKTEQQSASAKVSTLGQHNDGLQLAPAAGLMRATAGDHDTARTT